MKQWILLMTLLFATNVANAGEYASLIPGQSTKAQADAALGKPVREVIPKQRYDYAPEAHDAKKLSVLYNPQTQVVEAINIYPKYNYLGKQFAEWFDLKSPSSVQYDHEGNFTEFYNAQGVALYYDGPDNKSIIKYFSHYAVLPGTLNKSAQTGWGKKFSPVEHSQSAQEYCDEAESFIRQNQYSLAIPLLKKAHLLEPQNTLYSSRLGYAYLKNNNLNDAIKSFNHSLSVKNDYQAAKFLGIIYFRKHQFKDAIGYLKQALAMKSKKEKEPDLIEYLGTSYYEEGRLKEALNTFVTSYKMDRKRPISAYYLGLISDRLGNNPDAKFYYKKFLKLRYNNSEMNQLAKERLTEVSKALRQKSRSKHSWSELFNTVSEDLKEFNKDN